MLGKTNTTLTSVWQFESNKNSVYKEFGSHILISLLFNVVAYIEKLVL
jgi:hypothetical protein